MTVSGLRRLYVQPSTKSCWRKRSQVWQHRTVLMRFLKFWTKDSCTFTTKSKMKNGNNKVVNQQRLRNWTREWINITTITTMITTTTTTTTTTARNIPTSYNWDDFVLDGIETAGIVSAETWVGWRLGVIIIDFLQGGRLFCSLDGFANIALHKNLFCSFKFVVKQDSSYSQPLAFL